MNLNDLLRSHRSQEEWSWEMLDTQDNYIGDLAGVTSHSIKHNVAAPIRSGGSLKWKGKEEPNWLGIRIRPIYRCTFVDGTRYERQHGVFIPSTPEPTYNGMYLDADVEFYDKLLVLKEDSVDETFALAAGTVVTTAIRDIIVSAGETKHSIEDSTATLVNSMTWDAGTSKLTMVNELLDVINYFSLHMDDAGYYRGDPYVPTSSRGSSWDFSSGDGSIYRPGWKHSKDYFGKPNKVILTSQGSGDEPAMIATATNTDVNDPLGYGGARGSRWVTVKEDGIEAASQAILDDIAERRLKSLAEVSSTFYIQHALVPLELNNLVTFSNSREGIDVRGVIQEMELACETGKATNVSTTIREVK